MFNTIAIQESKLGRDEKSLESMPYIMRLSSLSESLSACLFIRLVLFLFVYINVCMIFSFSLCLPVSVFFYICLSRLIFQLFFLSFSPISPSPFLPYPSLPTLPPPLPCYHTNINEIQINVMTQQGERGDVGEKKR